MTIDLPAAKLRARRLFVTRQSAIVNSLSGFVDRVCDPVGGSRRGFLSPIEVVRVGADEVHAPLRLDERRPELLQRPNRIRGRLAGRRPRIRGPDHGVGLLDVLGLPG